MHSLISGTPRKYNNAHIHGDIHNAQAFRAFNHKIEVEYAVAVITTAVPVGWNMVVVNSRMYSSMLMSVVEEIGRAHV